MSNPGPPHLASTWRHSRDEWAQLGLPCFSLAPERKLKNKNRGGLGTRLEKGSLKVYILKKFAATLLLVWSQYWIWIYIYRTNPSMSNQLETWIEVVTIRRHTSWCWHCYPFRFSVCEFPLGHTHSLTPMISILIGYEYFSAVISTRDGSVHSCACDSTAHHFLLLLCWECVLCHTHCYHLMFILPSWFSQLHHTLWVCKRSWIVF